MTQDLYKRRSSHWKGSPSGLCPEARQHEQRYQYLMDKFRQIDINTLNTDSNESWPGGGSGGGFSEDPIVHHPSPSLEAVSSVIPCEPEDDWDNPKPDVDLRNYNFEVEGLLCPYCKDSVMGQDVMTRKLRCQKCTTYLETTAPLLEIKRQVWFLVQVHNQCPSNMSPDYSLFKDKIILTCHVCNLKQIVS